ncbi:hypothetical protein BDP81DRAFT_433361 [Colletotrichum phormii]|uniref:Uncharacterized protein n=1 Tax=Colletotrichum phormii TaxID=359342 RepID=A0AAI9ZKZ5_9PEZI|nr:uncharacterized protein BDP81DRAFT_433361 [Colletotrichum phormii]KAK1633916.1 hypothetical protein BDP81DRAFT_433361 [Colletotrichum phormii]
MVVHSYLSRSNDSFTNTLTMIARARQTMPKWKKPFPPTRLGTSPPQHSQVHARRRPKQSRPDASSARQ